MEEHEKTGRIRRLWRWWRRPSRLALGTLLIAGCAGGILFLGGFNAALEASSSEAFCISCHEMRDNVYQEYMETAHYSNRSGMRATCPDCHVPHEFVPKMVRKIQASREVYASVLGTIDTPQKFEAHRLAMAQNEWRRMKNNDSRECRNCHDLDHMDFFGQTTAAAEKHAEALKTGQTCIDCHKGVAHKLPDMSGVPDDF